MKLSLRSAFTRWLELNNEQWRKCGHRSAYGNPSWFKWELMKVVKLNKVFDNEKNWYKNQYEFYISDEELLRIKRPIYKKGE